MTHLDVVVGGGDEQYRERLRVRLEERYGVAVVGHRRAADGEYHITHAHAAHVGRVVRVEVVQVLCY